MNLNRDTIKTIITNDQETRKNLWTAFIVLTGAVGTMVLDINTPAKVGLIGVGTLLDFILIYFISSVNTEINENINLLKREDKGEQL